MLGPPDKIFAWFAPLRAWEASMIDTTHPGIGTLNVISDFDTALRGEAVGGPSSRRSRASPQLTARERDILGMISQGFSNKCIARALAISPETVKSHVKHIFMKLEVATRTEAVCRAMSLELL
jgi:ATP/maltotriose-dependent transcriptional regulator MalT